MNQDELRELDRQVAEADGCQLVPTNGYWACSCPDGKHAGELVRYLTANGNPTGTFALAAYSSDPAASRVLLDEMTEAVEPGLNYDMGQWYAAIYMPGRGRVGVPPHRTLDVAICRAWLAWKAAK